MHFCTCVRRARNVVGTGGVRPPARPIVHPPRIIQPLPLAGRALARSVLATSAARENRLQAILPVNFTNPPPQRAARNANPHVSPFVLSAAAAWPASSRLQHARAETQRAAEAMPKVFRGAIKLNGLKPLGVKGSYSSMCFIQFAQRLCRGALLASRSACLMAYIHYGKNGRVKRGCRSSGAAVHSLAPTRTWKRALTSTSIVP